MVALAAAGVPNALLSEPAAAQAPPAVLGTWTLDADKTEEPRDRVIEEPEATGAGRTMRTGLGGRGSRGGGGGGGGGTGGARGGRSSFGRMFGGMMQASQTLKIMQADSVLTIDDEDGPVFVNVRTDGKTIEEPMADQTILKTKAQWRKTDLVVERSHEVNGSARMILKVDPKNPKVMIVEFHYENKRQRRTIDQKRIYNASS
jgi:hypothetical protein